MERAVRYMVGKHRAEDDQSSPSPQRDKEAQQIETLRRHTRKIKDWLKGNDDKPGKSRGPRKSNITDNDSAKMKTSHGVLQGYDGVASVDAQHQIVVHAEAFGEAQEHDLLQPMIAETRGNFQAIGKDEDIFARARVTADSGFHTEQNVKTLFAQGVDAYLADNQLRKRDPRFASAERHRARAKAERQKAREQGRYRPSDFIYDEASQTCVCPAGKPLYRNGSNCRINGNAFVKFQGAKMHCVPCAQRAQCLQHPDRTPTRQVVFFKGRVADAPETYTQKMKKKIDTAEGRSQYSRRLGIVEPVFANICSTLGLSRFSLRGRIKVDLQWKLYCIVHNLIKIHRFGFASG